MKRHLLFAAWLVVAGSIGVAGWAAGSGAADRAGKSGRVELVEEPLTLPTYELGPAEPNPIFYTQESYQGAQKRVYPYALQDHLTHVRTNRTYRALRLENAYVRVRLLPELGGRLFEGYDKSNGYDFFYRQHVIKPALIGMLGAWISGGIEWCAFHHHRNTTFMPVDYIPVENPDGSKTAWIGETERRHRMRWLIGVTLHPDRSYLEVTGRFFNRTALPHSILNWANVAVHVNEDYQVLFPPSVQVAAYHSKIDFTQWPVSQVRYRGVNYQGVDLSWWKNHPEPNSFFAWDLQEDFMGGYDHGRQAGVVHVADHHVVCSAKLWEWGTGPSGRMWDKILTDDDGPYAELMVGAFSDNQPDYSWIEPGETKTWRQYWYPVRGIGGFKNANLEGAANLELRANGTAWVGFHTTEARRGVRIVLTRAGQSLFTAQADLDPAHPFGREIPVPAGTRATELRAALLSAQGRELIAFQPVEREPVKELPQPVNPPRPPGDVASVEELVLTGLRIEQIHNPTVDPARYYEEALKRDPGDSRAHTALGIRELRRGLYEAAGQHFRAAIGRVAAEYTRPANAEAHYYLGLALRALDRRAEARDQFHRAAWDAACRPGACQQLAELACAEEDFPAALRHLEDAPILGSTNPKALCLRALVLRYLGRPAEALESARRALALDPLDFLAAREALLAESCLGRFAAAAKARAALQARMRGEVQSYLELAADYLGWGRIDEAIAVLDNPLVRTPFASTYPLFHYWQGYLLERKGSRPRAQAAYARAAQMPPDYCFPFRLESAAVLDAALRANPRDARAWYYLGNLYYELQPERAISCWEKSRALDPSLATVHRNLGWGFQRVRNDLTNAVACYEQALACNGLDPRLFLELDQLYELGNAPPEKRLAAFERNVGVVRRRVECFTREIAVRVLTGRYDEAIACLSTNFFHVREGGGEIHDTYVDAHLLRGLECLRAQDAAAARRHFELAGEYPENLSVGRPKNDRRAAQVAWCLGRAWESAGDDARAREQYRQAAAQTEASGGPETRFYQALCWQKLGEPERAAAIFQRLEDDARRDLEKGESSDFFAKFGEQETRQTRKAAAHYALGLARYGRGEREPALREFDQAAQLNRSHVWARYYARGAW